MRNIRTKSKNTLLFENSKQFATEEYFSSILNIFHKTTVSLSGELKIDRKINQLLTPFATFNIVLLVKNAFYA